LVYAASLTAAASPFFVAAGRGALARVSFVPLFSPTTTVTNITPNLNGVAMQNNSANVALQIPAASAAGALVGPQDVNGGNVVNEGDVVSLVSDGGAANAASVPGYYTVVVRESSIFA
jgi:hypothetical protein